MKDAFIIIRQCWPSTLRETNVACLGWAYPPLRASFPALLHGHVQ